MRSLKQNRASRTNGAKSHGPLTPETKTISSANSLKHGFNSKNIVLQNENPVAWEHHHQCYLDQFHPASKPEHDLVTEMAAAMWRLRRLTTIETATLDLAMDRQAADLEKEFESFDEPTRLACAFQKLADGSRSLSLLSRYEARLRKAYDQALANLLKIQALRIPPVPAPDSVRNEPDSRIVTMPRPAGASPASETRPAPAPDKPGTE